MNAILFQSYQFGVVIGIIILSTLILFPGISKSDTVDNDEMAAEDDTNDTIATNASPVTAPALLVSPETRKGHLPRTHQANSNINSDVDIPNFLSPHRRLNWMVYVLIYIVMTVIIFYSYQSTLENPDTLPLYRRQLQNPTKLLQLTFEAYFPKEASLLDRKSVV